MTNALMSTLGSDVSLIESPGDDQIAYPFEESLDHGNHAPQDQNPGE
jgi:hypothetical protein